MRASFYGGKWLRNKVVRCIVASHAQERPMTRLQKKLVHEGESVAEVEVDVIETDEGWSPYLTLEDAERLDDVREGLRTGDVTTAAKLARISHSTPV